MTDFAGLLLPDRGEPAHRLTPVAADGLDAWLKDQPAQVRALAEAGRFKAKPGELLILPGRKDGEWSAAFGKAKAPGPWDIAAIAQKLPAGTYRIDGDGGDDHLPGALGWLLAHHRFDRYLAKPDSIPARVLLTRDAAAIAPTVALAEAVALVRDLVDTPAADMGPAELADAAEAVAKAHAAEFRVTRGDALDQGYPMIAAVGRAAVRDRAPRLIEIEWGDPAHPRIAIVGKGVCFDSGGLDLKPSSAMLLMKKDMGGAAHALALAGLVMGARLPVRLHLLIPAVENAVAGDAFRPGDILRSRRGISVEIGNTDAEGRLVLGDALARAGEDKPDLILDFATLTGAARVALGPDLPAMFANDDALAAELLAAAVAVSDPVWRMPLWADYAEMIKSTTADINNAGEGGMAGAVTAALFLQRFVPDATPWAHFDTFAWRPSARPGRPKGGDALGLRAAFAMLRARFVTP
ncbi:leucyl aminopeptidase family protein [Rhizorhabdus wittichii]|uniref:Leucyl aminopeptidase family protein n=1 Tax=Rhizorhabdus wittichii TaxID=160791 RepID=A0A975D3M2_9SPHN|nr:leucyl aminopeptidase family protein [Rhizorhabdus wittichii]QTH22387.1 leucyl aminopeptidase family protein [Rhizorhabdus wittichii]